MGVVTERWGLLQEGYRCTLLAELVLGGVSMHSLLGIHWIARTYGTWLHGDPRGSWYQGHLIEGDRPLEMASRSSMTHDVVKLSPKERAMVEHTIRTVSTEFGHTLLALAVQPTHVHVVFSPMAEPVKSVVARLKRRTSMEVLHRRRQRGAEDVASSIWSAKRFLVFVTDERHLQNTIAYVERHHAAKPRS